MVRSASRRNRGGRQGSFAAWVLVIAGLDWKLS
jgi:hypothetical protein